MKNSIALSMLALFAASGCASARDPVVDCDPADAYDVTYSVLSGDCEAPEGGTWLSGLNEEPADCHTMRATSKDGCDWYIARQCERWVDGQLVGRSWHAGTVSAVAPGRLEGVLGIEGWDVADGQPVAGSSCRGELSVTYTETSP